MLPYGAMWKKVGQTLNKAHAGRILRLLLLAVCGFQVVEAVRAFVSGNSTELSAHVATVIGLLAIAQVSLMSEQIRAQAEISKRQGKLILNIIGLDQDSEGNIHRMADQREHERRQKVEPDHDDCSCVCCCESCSVSSPVEST